MATKKAKTKKGARVSPAEAFRDSMGHSVEGGLAATTGEFAAPKRVEDLPEPGTARDEDEPEAPDARSSHDELPAEEPEAPKVEAPKEPTKAEVVAARRRTSPKAAAKHVSACLKMLALHDWPEIGIDGISGAVAVLRSALPKLEAIATKRATFKLAPGSVARLRSKTAARWEGVLPTDADLRVVELRKLSAVVEAPDGVRAVVAIRELERGAAS
jgi:hypothetical protein